MDSSGCCLWMTGLSGSGKTSIAVKFVEEMCKRSVHVEYLDGDIIRQLVCSDLGFSKEDRDLSPRYLTICAFISPYKDAREKARNINNNFIEIFVDASLEVCEQRDVKGLYKKARAGQIKQFTGIDDPYEPPDKPDIHLRTDIETIDESAQKIIDYLENHGFLD